LRWPAETAGLLAVPLRRVEPAGLTGLTELTRLTKLTRLTRLTRLAEAARLLAEPTGLTVRAGPAWVVSGAGRRGVRNSGRRLRAWRHELCRLPLTFAATGMAHHLGSVGVGLLRLHDLRRLRRITELGFTERGLPVLRL
jgi:hypothetical protein